MNHTAAELREMADQISRGHMPPSGRIMTALRQAADAMGENVTLRRIVANSSDLCVYCGLAKADMAKCERGFPGCARADDMLTTTPKDTP